MSQHKTLHSRGVLHLSLLAPLFAALVLLRGAAQAQPPADAPPLVLLRPQDTQFASTVVAVHPNGKRAYVGEKYNTHPNRLGLLVYTLNDKGEASGPARPYRDSALPLPDKGRTSINAITPDARYRKLYVGYGLEGGGDENRFVSVYDLDENGEPVGDARSYFSGNPNKAVGDIAVHPRHPVLYMGGWGSAAVHYYQLDEKGEPQGEPQTFGVGGQGKSEINVSADGKRLYLGTYPDVVEVVDLDDKGIPTGKPRTFKAGSDPNYLRFEASARALYLKKTTPDGTRLAIWPLDAAGDPTGQPQIREDLPVSGMAIDAARGKLWIAADDTFKDAFSGKTIVQGVRPQSFVIKADGSLGAADVSAPSGFKQQGLALAAAGGHAVLLTSLMPRGVLGNRVKDYRLRATVLAAKSAADAAPPKVGISVGLFNRAAPVKIKEVAIGETSEWGNLDELLKDTQGPHMVAVNATGNLAQLKLRIEIAEGDPAAGGKLLQTMTDEVHGSKVLLLLPGYGFDPPEQRVAAIETMTDHAAKYLAAARAVGLKPEERPKLFNVSAHQLLGGQGSVEQLKRQAETIALLGFNTVNAYWWDSISPEQINTVLDSFGLQRRTSAVYNPPSYFAYDAEKMNPPALEEWAKKFPEGVAKTNAGSLTDVVTHYLADEPGWYYPGQLTAVRDNPKWLAAFHDYLKEKGLIPSDLGQNSWNEVLPIGASEGAKPGASLGTRRLFYWTMRFYPESAARGHRMATDALRKVYGHPIDTPVNWNNWLSNWYGPSPNQKIANNNIIGPDSAYGSMDWFENGRYSSNTLWSEDWFGDQSAQNWSLYSDLLRSASMQGQSRFGGYVIGLSTGGFPSGAKYKILSLLGHGGKSLDMFTFGPELLFPGNCWSEGLYKYGPIADALRLVGRSERLLYTGRPERGKVAILIPSASRLWEQQQKGSLYQSEVYGLHSALVHAGYGVDFVDDIDLSGDDWSKRGYTTLYITGPNVAAAAQEKIVTWVRNGGTLVATPGAGVADEYNTRVTTLDTVLGVEGRREVREGETPRAPGQGPSDYLVAKDQRFAAAKLELQGPVAALKTGTAAPLATLQSGGAAITGNTFGKGRGIAYGFFPGWHYSHSPTWSDGSRLPQNWSEPIRKLVVAPVRIAATPRSITVSEEGIEAVRLQSDKGIAVTLLNWAAQPQTELNVTIPNTGKFSKVTAASGAAVRSTPVTGGLKVTFALKDVDVLMVE